VRVHGDPHGIVQISAFILSRLILIDISYTPSPFGRGLGRGDQIKATACLIPSSCPSRLWLPASLYHLHPCRRPGGRRDDLFLLLRLNFIPQQLQGSQGRIVVRLITNFTNQLCIHNLVVFIDDNNGPGGNTGQRAIGDQDTVVLRKTTRAHQ